MSQSVAQYLLESRGTHCTLDAFVVAVCFDRAGATVAFALGDGTLRLVKLAERETWDAVEAHDGAVLSLAADTGPTGFISGGDDGKFRHIDREIADFRGKWVEHVASHPGEKGKSGLLACAVGKAIHLFSASGEKLKELPHPSTVTGLTFDARGKRVAASHYNGASLWFVNAKEDSPRRLEWKGSHTADRDPSGRRRRGDRDAGERAARLAPVGQPAHAHERLSRENRIAVFHAQRQVAGDQRCRFDGALAVLRWWPDGQGADRARRW